MEEGKAKVFGPDSPLAVDTLYIDGNGLLHPAMQYTFGYGGFESEERQRRNETREFNDVVREGVTNFAEVLRSLCAEFRPGRLVVAIDGSAPVAKMVQQRQRRFGAKMDVSGDGSLERAWETVLRRNMRQSVDQEQTFISLRVVYNRSLKDGGRSLVVVPQTALVEGTPQKKVYDALTKNLVDKSGGERLRWYNVLSPETPLGFSYAGRNWYTVAAAAASLAWLEIYGQGTWKTLLSFERPPEISPDTENRYLLVGGKPSEAVDKMVTDQYREFVRFKELNKDFFVRYASTIARYCFDIAVYLAETYPLYRDILVRTGFGTNLEDITGRRIDWLMKARKYLFQRLEAGVAQSRELPQETPVEAVEYPEMEVAFRGDKVGGALFDSNCLTPGTAVMDLIDRELERLFRGERFTVRGDYAVEVVYSGHRIPGEGEHKIMNFLDREERRTSPGKTNLVYGLDADLFMLTLVRPQPLTLVRENRFHVSKFRGEDVRRDPLVSSCHVVDITRLRTLLREDESRIDPADFTFMSFLFGNDFLRNVPGFVFDRELKMGGTVLFDFVLETYGKLREDVERGDGGIFINSSRSGMLRVDWYNVYRFLRMLANHEAQIFDALLQKMDLEKERERKMTARMPEYVPVELRYKLLIEARATRQKIVGGVIDRRAVMTSEFDLEGFRAAWSRHITANIPGLVDGELSRNKSDVLEKICRSFLSGMEWISLYYTNRHYVDRERARSTLNTSWFYPYFHAPTISQLSDHLWRFLLEDAVRAARADPHPNPERTLTMLLQPLLAIPPAEHGPSDAVPAMREILRLVPTPVTRTTLAGMGQDTAELVRTRVGDLLQRENKPAEPPRRYGRMFEQPPTAYRGSRTFMDNWGSPRMIFGARPGVTLVAPSTTNHKVQLLAVLPAQSAKYFPDGIDPSDRAISWMFPKTIPVDFTLRDRVHMAILQLPPPSIDDITSFLRLKRKEALESSVPEGMFPTADLPWKLNEPSIRKGTQYWTIHGILRDLEQEHREIFAGGGVDVAGGMGIAAMALMSFTRRGVHVVEPSRSMMEDTRHNLGVFPDTNEAVTTYQSTPLGTTAAEVADKSMFIFDVAPPRGRRGTSDTVARVQMRRENMHGTRVDKIIEEISLASNLDKVGFLVHCPFYMNIGRVEVPGATVQIKKVSDVDNTKYISVVVTKSLPEPSDPLAYRPMAYHPPERDYPMTYDPFAYYPGYTDQPPEPLEAPPYDYYGDESL